MNCFQATYLKCNDPSLMKELEEELKERCGRGGAAWGLQVESFAALSDFFVWKSEMHSQRTMFRKTYQLVFSFNLMLHLVYVLAVA